MDATQGGANRQHTGREGLVWRERVVLCYLPVSVLGNGSVVATDSQRPSGHSSELCVRFVVYVPSSHESQIRRVRAQVTGAQAQRLPQQSRAA